ncbi:pentapeptide repeat-containing protein [Polaromonas sp.]|uniref:pentapeptide repeat-containing protein n=1 Tax=Polaromonas sp. TaxID=1869339 RepID=UPI003BB4E665
MKRRLALVLLAAAFLAASCGGGGSGDTSLPTGGTGISTGIGTGSVPLYQSATETLTLPQLRVAGNILADVKLLLKKDGKWALISSGSIRPASASDKPGAALAEPGGNTDLGGAQTDTTLTVARLHVGARVFGNVTVRLTGKTWAFASSPQEVKTLHQEDFKSNTAIRADESHHVILKSSPDSGVQNVPMQLSSRNYKFCMDAQAEGADSTTLLDAAGKPVFTLKAGEPCVTLKPREGAYTLQHRYGGTGSARTVFMHHQANTTTATKSATGTSAAEEEKRLKASGVASASVGAASAGFPGAEYWSIRRAALTPADPDFYVYLGVTARNSSNLPKAGAIFCSDPLMFAYADQWQAGTFIRVDKDNIFGVANQLAQPLACTSAQLAPINASHVYISAVGDPTIRSFPVYAAGYADPVPYSPLSIGQSDDGRAFPSYYDSGPCNGDLCNDPLYSVASLAVTNLAGNQFGLFTTQTRSASITFLGTLLRPAVTTSGPVVSPLDGSIAVGNTATDIAKPMAVGFRYFPDGLASTVALGVGQVALFTGANCSGAAVITEDINMPSFSASSMPRLAGLGSSFRLGLQTSATAFALPLYNGEPQQFDQLTCSNSSMGSSGQPMASLSVVVDTITMVLSTDSCEYCNLAGVDFSGHDLTNVKLSHANLNGAILSGVDLSGADLRNASLQGAYLVNANLDGANLCSAQLNGSPNVLQAATLTGAHLRNTNLALASLDGVRLSSASFYSSNGQGACQQTSCSSYVASTCASAYGATINNASFDSAYLSNVDMSNVKGAGVSFNNAALFGVLFGQADLSHNTVSSVNSSFFNTYLQGTDLSRANLQFAEFTGAQFDAASDCMQTNLNPAYSNFPGGMVLSNSSKPTCVPRKPPAATVCVQSSFTASPGYPKTDCTNICADGSAAGGVVPTNGTCQNTATCSVASWTNTLKVGGNSAMPTSSCLSNPPLCGNAFTSGADPCW